LKNVYDAQRRVRALARIEGRGPPLPAASPSPWASPPTNVCVIITKFAVASA